MSRLLKNLDQTNHKQKHLCSLLSTMNDMSPGTPDMFAIHDINSLVLEKKDRYK